MGVHTFSVPLHYGAFPHYIGVNLHTPPKIMQKCDQFGSVWTSCSSNHLQKLIVWSEVPGNFGEIPDMQL